MKPSIDQIGDSQPRKDAWAKVTGQALYTADVPLRHKRHGVLVRSPYHHARIRSIDLSAARESRGVEAILTAEDVPGKKTFGAIVQDQPVLAMDVVRHIGEPVALVVAETKDLALRAARLVRVDYDPLPAVFDPRQALQAGAVQVQPAGNLLTSYTLDAGDAATGFEEADVILDEEFSVQRISPAYLEPENSLARWNSDGTITVWVSSQKPFYDCGVIAEVLDLPVEQVQVISSVIGGAFGGKEDASLAVLTALAAWKIRGVVQIVNSRRESFTAHPKRHPARLHFRLGAKRDGRLCALQAVVHMDTGAYASYGPAVGGLLTEMLPGPYRIPHVALQTYVVYTNSPYSGAMRGFGAPQAHFALESCMDMLAERLELDPLELRRRNILQPGDRLATGVILDETALSLPQILDTVAQARRRLEAIPNVDGRMSGVGFALAVQSMGLGAKIYDHSTERLEWLPDGRVLIHLGAPDLGQGLATVSEQITAAALGLPYEQVISIPVDTRTSPNGGYTCASRMTYLVGNALLAASKELIAGLLRSAAGMLSMSVEQLTYAEGVIIDPANRRYPASEFASRAADSGEPIVVEAGATFAYPEETTPQQFPVGMPHVKYAFAGQVARVEVDAQVGTAAVTDLVVVQDVGKAINRAAVAGQMEGGAVMGIGYALYEDVALKSDGRWVDSLSEYLLPTVLDVPVDLESVILEIPEATGPYGAKGAAEISVTPSAPAVANAIYNACRVRVHGLPITPEKLAQVS
jgi:CO/xanthine dehydrogenase Mo-binding subunit